MDNEDIEGSETQAGRGRKYRPVVAQDNDRAVLEMSSMDPDSSHPSPLPNRSQSMKLVPSNNFILSVTGHYIMCYILREERLCLPEIMNYPTIIFL